MYYQLIQQDIIVATDKKWLKRHEYHSMAIKLYGVLAKQQEPLDLSDETMTNTCVTSKVTYQEAKRQLVYSGLLEIHKINSTTIVFVLGDKAIRSYARRILAKEDQRLTRKTIESLELPGSTEPLEEDDTMSVYTNEDLQALYDKVQRPKPLDLLDIL